MNQNCLHWIYFVNNTYNQVYVWCCRFSKICEDIYSVLMTSGHDLRCGAEGVESRGFPISIKIVKLCWWLYTDGYPIANDTGERLAGLHLYPCTKTLLRVGWVGARNNGSTLHQVRCILWEQEPIFNKGICILCGLEWFIVNIFCEEHLQPSIFVMFLIF